MLTRSKPNWELPESAATSESDFQDRRRLVKAMAIAPILAAGAALPGGSASAATVDPTAKFYPAARNLRYRLDRPLNTEKEATTYNNFYEFGSHKKISEAAQKLKIRPWSIKLDGMVEKEIEIDFDDLVRKMQIEERLYRHRCVEAWSMAVPWSGFPFRALVDFAKPLSGAKYVRMETLADKETMPGLRQFWYPWPYTEGVSIQEADNDLAFIVTGAYGQPMANQFGAPLRLHLPWKYGFKSVKSIVRISFTEERPTTFWEELVAKEYGFWANVNPEVSHPRWSQATEKVLGSNERIPTQLYNGYGEQVAYLYEGMDPEELFF